MLRQRDDADRIAALTRLVGEWSPVLLVIGLPLDREGGEQPQTRRVRRFAELVRLACGLPVFFHDERYSTVVAEATLRDAGADSRQIARHADAEAAREILRGYLDARPPRINAP